MAQAPSALQHFCLNKKGDKVKKIEFRSTFKIGPGNVPFPNYMDDNWIGIRLVIVLLQCDSILDGVSWILCLG